MKSSNKFFQNKKVLLVGLGILGGGTSMAKFILEQGGDLTITDLRSKDLLQKELLVVEGFAKKKNKKVKFTLEAHSETDFKSSDVVVFNPAVPYYSAWPQFCLKNKIEHYNDFTLFQEYLLFKYKDNLSKKPKQVWITGTRGKSTTTAFIHHLLGPKAVIGGNVLGQGLQKISSSVCEYFVLETSNYQLEYPIYNKKVIEPSVAVITNIFVDHINRHKTVAEYRRVKKLIFSYKKGVALFLNKDEKSIKDIIEKNSELNISAITSFDNLQKKYKKFSKNQIISLSFAIAVAEFFDVPDKYIKSRIKTLKVPKMRQEVVYESKKFKVINDSTATSPDALLASLGGFPNAYFISGGTDAELDFSDLIKEMKKLKIVDQNRMFFLKGSATDKILSKLKKESDTKIYDSLETAIRDILECIKEKKVRGQSTIILSPGAKSFGLFKNEYDRGEMFNKIVKKIFV
jgi:UDP-N-acetylmuramoylalanine--D-glutamate ligase